MGIVSHTAAERGRARPGSRTITFSHGLPVLPTFGTSQPEESQPVPASAGNRDRDFRLREVAALQTVRWCYVLKRAV
jgi:hypothetical protein